MNLRLVELDVLRGWAIVLMVIFHISYDLDYFKYIDIDIKHSHFWVYFRYFIVTLFLLSMGISLNLSHKTSIKWDKVKKRVLLLGGASALVSMATYLVFPNAWVYFGILHFVLFASLLGLFFIPYPLFSLVLALVIFIGYIMGYIHMHWLWDIINQNILTLPEHTVDLVSFTPWFSVVLIGMAMASYGYHEKLLRNSFFKVSLKHNEALAYLGKHSLLIYLIHQPILFGFLMLLET